MRLAPPRRILPSCMSLALAIFLTASVTVAPPPAQAAGRKCGDTAPWSAHLRAYGMSCGYADNLLWVWNHKWRGGRRALPKRISWRTADPVYSCTYRLDRTRGPQARCLHRRSGQAITFSFPQGAP